MKYVSLFIFLVACSNSLAQEVKPKVQPSLSVVVVEPESKLEPTFTEPEPRKVIRNNKLEYEWLAKICVSEGGFNIRECEKILQTLENMRRSNPLLTAMYAQSARITRRKPFTDIRQIWVSYLQMQGETPPTKGWIECSRDVLGHLIPNPCTGTWASTVKKWTSFREEVKNLYYSGIVPTSIPGVPIQWGGDMDYWRGVGRNFCPLNIGGLLHNTYWGDPRNPANEGKCLIIDKNKVEQSKALTAEIASGRAMRKHYIPKLLEKNENPLIQNLKEEDINNVTNNTKVN